MPLVVIEALISIRIGSPSVGMPMAIGSGVNTGLVPPNGATVASDGSELATMHIIWPLGRLAQKDGKAADMVAAPDRDGGDAEILRARSAARSSALRTSQTPGRKPPSQVTAAGRSAMTVRLAGLRHGTRFRVSSR